MGRHLGGFLIFGWMMVVSSMETTELGLAGFVSAFSGYELSRSKSSFLALFFCFISKENSSWVGGVLMTE